MKTTLRAEGRGRGARQLLPPCPESGQGIATGDGRILVTRRGLAVALGVSLRTVERMLHDEEIKPVWVRGAQRFHVPDVVRELAALGATRKNGRKAEAEKLKAEMLEAETRYPRRVE